MANAPVTAIEFISGAAPDCGVPKVTGLPQPLPDVGDDFDWLTRDYDGFRRLMMEELAARVPERDRWTPADLEVVVVEALAAVLDQLSDMLDRVTAETCLETARCPDSVRRLLSLIGYDAMARAEPPAKDLGELQQRWEDDPSLMEAARRAGPRELRDQERLVTEADFCEQIEAHPLVLRARAVRGWSGSWPVTRVAVLLRDGASLTKPVEEEGVQETVNNWHTLKGIEAPRWSNNPKPTAQDVLTEYLEAYRMCGHEVQIEEIVRAQVSIALTVGVGAAYFRSEVQGEIRRVLGDQPGGFFDRERLPVGADLYASDLIEAVLSVEGTETVLLDQFQRAGPQALDQRGSMRIALHPLEMVMLKGGVAITLTGGRAG